MSLAQSKQLVPATKPTFYFVGVTTGKSSIMSVFPAWAEHLGLGDSPIRGIDCKWHDDRDVYRDVVNFLKHDDLSLGALVTTHKIDLLAACRDLFDELGPYAQQLGEISCISKRDGKLRGHAKDPITAGLAYEAIVAQRPESPPTDVCLLGAGGSSLALTLYLQGLPEDRRPARICVTNRSPKRIEEMQRVHSKMACPIPVDYHICPDAQDNDEVVATLKPGSMVVNATGLGKDGPGSPLTNSVQFPEGGIVWEFNYRGNLVFLDQAQAQKDAKALTIEDGWVYFIHGWTRVIAEVFDIDIPTSGPDFDTLCDIAASKRR